MLLLQPPTATETTDMIDCHYKINKTKDLSSTHNIPLFVLPSMLIAITHESMSEHCKQTPSVNALQSGDVFVQGKGRL